VPDEESQMARTKPAEEKLQGEDKLPGVPLAQFQAAVDAVAELRDAGGALIFLRRHGVVKIVGLAPSAAEFSQQLNERLQELALSESQIKETLEEIGDVITILLRAPSEVEATKTLLYRHLSGFRKVSTFNLELPTHRHVFDKVQAGGKLVTDALKQRHIRLLSSTTATPEDLDTELVWKRQDRVSGSLVEVPFLRLRLRYAEQTIESSNLPLYLFGLQLEARSFEIECDLSDLDLLQTRLDEARRILLDATAVKEMGDAKSGSVLALRCKPAFHF